MRLPLKTVPLLAAVLAACQQDVSVELAGTPLEGADAVVLEVDGVQLLRRDGSVLSLPLAAALGALDVTGLQGGNTVLLADRSDDFEGEYSGVRPRFSSAAFVREADGTQKPLQVVQQPDYARIDFELERSEAASLVMELALPFSVRLKDDASGYELRPVLRTAMREDGGSLVGFIDTALLESAACRGGRATGRGVAAYLFAGAGRDPADYNSSGTPADQAVAYAPVLFNTADGRWSYALRLLQPGSYTVALTCQADREDPAQDDGLDFLRQADAEIAGGKEIRRDF